MKSALGSCFEQARLKKDSHGPAQTQRRNDTGVQIPTVLSITVYQTKVVFMTNYHSALCVPATVLSWFGLLWNSKSKDLVMFVRRSVVIRKS